MNLTDFLLARIAEDEGAARAVPPLDYNVDMGGRRQDEQFIHGRTLPSSADGMGNCSEHRYSPTTSEHFERWEPERVLVECEAKRRIVALHRLAEHQTYRGTECCARCTADGEYPADDAYSDEQNWPCPTLRALALPYAIHPDYRDEWRP